MKKNVLALSIATLVGGLGFAGAASAQVADLQVAESGAGHILLVPYYSAQEGNISVFHLTNTDDKNGKAVKVRFRGAANSDDVLDFQVFMSPGDVWTAIVSQNPQTGLANLLTVDTTCTLPALPAAGKDFVTDRLTRSVWSDADKAAQTREGYVEILNMADIPVSTDDKSLYKAIKHVNGKAPCTPTVIEATADLRRLDAAGAPIGTKGYFKTGDVFSTAAIGADLNAVAPADVASYANGVIKQGSKTFAADLIPPSGGLTGQWYIMNLEQNTTFSGVMPAISPESSTAKTLNVFSPQLEEKAELASADPLFYTDASIKPVIEPQMYDVPDLSTPYAYTTTASDPTVVTNAVTQATKLTTALAKKTVLNQYATDVELDAKTDWVLSMPTRRYTIAADYRQDLSTETGKGKYRVTAGMIDETATPAGTYKGVEGNLFSKLGNSNVNAAGQICAASAPAKFWDREEQSVGKGPVFSPGTTATYSMCGEVAVLSFQESTSALGASLTRQNVKAPYTNGWGSVTFNADVPVIGAAFMKLTNNKVGNGVVANYGVTWAHTYQK